MALEILAVVVTPLNEMGKCLFGALKREINYLISYHANIRNLTNQVNLLEQKRRDVKRHARAAESRLDVLTEEVVDWLQNTQRTLEEDMRNLEQEVNSNKTCLKGLCPDLISRLKLSKKAVQMMEAVNCLLQQEGSFTSIAHCPPAAPVELVRTSSIVENLHSRDKVIEDVMEALGNDSIRSIAVHGMGGIGKTTLVDKINNKLQEMQLFKKVVKVVVSKKTNLNIIQDNIAARLDLDIERALSTAVRANRLFERLVAEESVLIILDDLWEKLDVVAIGIPVGSEYMGCKIILTTRDFNICNQMKIQKVVKLDPLSEDESWVLFETKVGDVVRCSNLKLIAQEIVRKCKGSPLAIATLGLTLRAQEKFVWKEALRVLNNPSQSGLQEIMPEVVKSVRFSYDHLQSWEIKLCFLFCCLYPEDYNIDLLDLRDYGVGERFLDVNVTLEDASNQLLCFVKKLKDCGLLLEGDGASNTEVKMHDVVRDVAIAIASDAENGFLVNVGRSSRVLRETEQLKGYKRMSFMKNENLVLPDPPLVCPQLRSLLIKGNKNASVANEESCFEGMKSLVVLDVSVKKSWNEDQIFYALPSLRCLSNLRTLYLVGCDLSNKVSSLGGLRKLEILRLCHSKIGRLPEEIGNLSDLMCLDLTNAELSIVEPNAISRLSNLEELYMLNHYRDWDRVGNASFAEVASLNHLSILRIHIGFVTPHDMQFHWWNNLKEFHIIIGRLSSIYSKPFLSYDSSSNRRIMMISDLNPVEHWVSKLLSIPKVRDLTLEKCVGLTNVGVVGGLKHLKKLVVRSCDDIEYLMSTEGSNMDSCGELKYFELESLPRMMEMFHGPTPSNTFFAQLRSLTLRHCGAIKKVFSSNLLLDTKRLQNLEELHVVLCYDLEEVFNTKEDELFRSPEMTPPPSINMMQLSTRMTLELWNLPKLTNIWKGVVPIGSLQHFKELKLTACAGIEYLSSYSSAVALESVKDIDIKFCDRMKKLIGSNKEKRGGATSSYSYSSKFTISPPPPTFPNLQTLHIYSCRNLKSLSSFTMARNLQQLRKLRVQYCENLEVIIAEEEEEEDVEHQYFLPRLRQLELCECKNLTNIIQGSLPIHCPLKTIRVFGCPDFKKLPVQPQISFTLETLYGTTEWFEGLEWEDESLRSLLRAKLKEGDEEESEEEFEEE